MRLNLWGALAIKAGVKYSRKTQRITSRVSFQDLGNLQIHFRHAVNDRVRLKEMQEYFEFHRLTKR